jgi:very-short-patch-repair endonuclease
MTGPEKYLWSRLRARQFYGFKFRRQHGVGPYIVDFYCPEQSLVIEIDGHSHAETGQILKDRQRAEYLQSIGLQVVRYNNDDDDVLKNLDGVLADLHQRLSSRSTPSDERSDLP